jgi:hypothetical protein
MPGLHLSPPERTRARVVDELALTLLYGMSELCACHRLQNSRETRVREELTYHSTPDCSKFVSLELLVSSTSRTNTSIVSSPEGLFGFVRFHFVSRSLMRGLQMGDRFKLFVCLRTRNGSIWSCGSVGCRERWRSDLRVHSSDGQF